MIEWITHYRILLGAALAVLALAWADHALRVWSLRHPARGNLARVGRRLANVLIVAILVGVLATHLYGAITSQGRPGSQDCGTEYDNRGAAVTCE
jgi:hypothetical protein